MNNKVIGTIAAIGTVAYLYSKDVFNSATFAASDSNCVNGEYNKMPPKKKDGVKFSTIALDGAKSDYGREKDWNKRYYKVTRYKVNNCARKCHDGMSEQKSIRGIGLAMKWAGKWKDTDGGTYIRDGTGDYCKSLAETVEEEKPVTEKPSNQDEEEEGTVVPDTSGDDEGTTATSTDWCSVKAKSPTWIKEIEGEIAEERLRLKKELEATITKAKQDSKKLSDKMEKQGTDELKRIKDRYAESKKKCSAKEEVQKKLQDSDVGEGFWEKLLAYLNA